MQMVERNTRHYNEEGKKGKKNIKHDTHASIRSGKKTKIVFSYVEKESRWKGRIKEADEDDFMDEGWQERGHKKYNKRKIEKDKNSRQRKRKNKGRNEREIKEKWQN